MTHRQKQRVQTNIQHPDDILSFDEVQVPDIAGENHEHTDACLTAMLRVWQFLEREDIETEEYNSVEEIDMDYREEISTCFEGIEMSLLTTDIVIANAMMLNEDGYSEWVNNHKFIEQLYWKPHTDWNGWQNEDGSSENIIEYDESE